MDGVLRKLGFEILISRKFGKYFHNSGCFIGHQAYVCMSIWERNEN